MESAGRNQLLDFSLISTERTFPFTRSNSGKTDREIQKAKARFAGEQLAKREGSRAEFTFTPPDYDSEYAVEIVKLESA